MYLDAPPPVTSIHLVIDVGTAVLTHIVSFGGKYELLSKLWLAIEGANTFQHVT